MQDYGRGIVIGQETYGKGTVQNLYPLDRYALGQDPGYGQLTVTIGMYYRVTGDSTQNRGVEPDIRLPSAISPRKSARARGTPRCRGTASARRRYKPRGHAGPGRSPTCSAGTSSASPATPTSSTGGRDRHDRGDAQPEVGVAQPREAARASARR